jgi:predicted aconitase
MKLTPEEQDMLNGSQGRAVMKAMEILHGLGTIYGAERMLPVSSVQIAGVSYANLGEAGLAFLTEMVEGGGKARVLTTLNPAGMDIENWKTLGISADFAHNQERVLKAFSTMGAITTCTCTPYLSGNLPHFGEHIAWSESSAVCYANSVLGARTNREGGPSALATSLTGCTPNYGLHLDQNRNATIGVSVETRVRGTHQFGALGKAIGHRLEVMSKKSVPLIEGIYTASMEELKSFCASIATYGGTALFHMQGITPEAAQMKNPQDWISLRKGDIQDAGEQLNNAHPEEIDFVSLGCPHLSIKEIAQIAALLDGRKVKKEFWITTSRPVKKMADMMDYTAIIEASGAKFAVDTCCVVAPIKGRFNALATDSAKACYYAYAKNEFKTYLLPFEEVVEEAFREIPGKSHL